MAGAVTGAGRTARWACAVVVATAAWSGAASTVAANPADMYGFGARSAGLASAGMAAANDSTANYYNPALLATLEDLHLTIGYQAAAPQLFVEGENVGVNETRGLVVGLAAPGRLAGRRVAMGGGLFLPDQQLVRTRILNSQQPRFMYYDNRGQRLFLSANIAVELTPRLFLGAGVAYMSSTQGAVTLVGRIGFPDASDSVLALDMDFDLDPIRYGHAGLLFHATPWLDLAFVARGGFTLTIDQTFDIQGDVGPSGQTPIVEDGFFTMQSAAQDLFQPPQFALAANAQLTADFLVAVDIALHRWSTYENPAAAIEINLDVGTFNDLVDIPDAPPLPTPNFHDIVTAKIGAEWTVASSAHRKWQARAGYGFEPTPAPEQTGETNFIDNDRHTFAAGVGLSLPSLGEVIIKPLRLDAFVSLTMLPGRLHRKMSPVDPIGDYRADGRVLSAGMSTHWRF